MKTWLSALLDRLNGKGKRGSVWIFAALFGVGLLLYLLSGLLNTKTADPEPIPERDASVQELTAALEQVLSLIPGAGRVRVILTLSQEQELIYQTDTDTRADGSGKVETVLKSGEGVVRTKRSPVYRGAVIACEGAQSPSVVLHIRAAVKSLTGLSGEQISVIPIKS